jgi:hypothetical protein
MDEEDVHDDALDRWLRERATPAAPPGFTSAVMTRVRQERWQTERYWDLGFNIAVAGGLLLIAVGVLGLIYISGLSVVGRDAMLLLADAIATAADEAAPVVPAYMGAFALTSTALGLWWYVENY